MTDGGAVIRNSPAWFLHLGVRRLADSFWGVVERMAVMQDNGYRRY